MPMQSSTLCRLPDEVLVDIAIEVVLLDTPLGPPSEIIPLLLTCRYINDRLSFQNCSLLYSRIFRGKFDWRAAARRLGENASYASSLAAQLKKHCIALKRIRRGDLDSEELEEDLWTAYLMCLEADGKNEAQLDHAGLDPLLDEFLRLRLWKDREYSNNWPAETTINCLVVWLYWLRLDQAKLVAMSMEEKRRILNLIGPYALTVLRYPSFFAPDNHFHFPLPEDMSIAAQNTLVTPHGFYPQYRLPSASMQTIEHYGQSLDISPPLISQGAKLLHMALSEVPFMAAGRMPRDRAHAHELGFHDVRVTQADILEINSHQSVKLIERGDWDWRAKLTTEQGELEDMPVWEKGLKAKSAVWDMEFNRLVYCGNPWRSEPLKGVMYEQGTLTGLWQGQFREPEVAQYFALTNSATMPADFSNERPHLLRAPVFMNVREHHCIMPESPVRCGGTDAVNDDGINNAWFPPMDVTEAGGFARVRDFQTGQVHRYETYVEGRPNGHNPDTCTVCVANQTEEDAELHRRVTALRAASDLQEVQQARTDINAALGPGEDADVILREAMDEDDTDTASDVSTEMENYIENMCSGICDIIVTGETLDRHGQAWHHYNFYGRIRSWDGLVAIVRVPDDLNYGVYILRGYIVAGNFVGSWRLRMNNPNAIPLEGPFVMSRA